MSIQVIRHFTAFEDTSYQSLLNIQNTLVKARQRHEIPDTLLLGVHGPVYTIGRGLQESVKNLVSLGTVNNKVNTPIPNTDIPVVVVERGGGITYHGPGQLVLYPIIHLSSKNIRGYVQALESAVINALAVFEITGFRQENFTGVWVFCPEAGVPKKIAAIGIAVKKWVTFHGLALNVNVDLGPFQTISPCGLSGKRVTSMAAVRAAVLHGTPIPMQEVQSVMIEKLIEALSQI